MQGITLQSQSPGAAGADLGFRLATMINGAPMAMRERELSLLVEQIAANRFTLPRNVKTKARITEMGTAIVEVHGILLNRSPYLGSFWGVSFYEGLAEQFRRLASDAEVKRIILDVDSPGGLVAGIKQAAAALDELADKKPVFALAHDMACSAGYWLACVAQELSVTPDGEVGSIGVRAGHVSYAEALDRDGIAMTIFRAGLTKADLSPYALLDDGAAAEEQFGIDRAYDRFCEHVARHRPLSFDEARATDARTFVGEKAIEAKLADRVETIEELIERVEKGATGVKRKKLSKTEPGSKAGAKTPPERVPVPPAKDEPAAGRSQTQRGARLMSERMEAAEAQDLAAQIAAALVDIRTKAEKPAASQQPAAQPQKSADEAIKEAVAAAEERIFGIIEAEEAKGRGTLAVALARSGLPAAAAKAILAAAPVEQAAKVDGGSDAAKLGTALAAQIAKPGNTAGIKPEAEGAGAKKSFSQLAAETAKKG